MAKEQYRGVYFDDDTMGKLLDCIQDNLAPDDFSIQPQHHLFRDLEAEQAEIWDLWFRLCSTSNQDPLRRRRTPANVIAREYLKKETVWDHWSDSIKRAQRVFGLKLAAGTTIEDLQNGIHSDCARLTEFMPKKEEHIHNGIAWPKLSTIMEGTEPATVERLLWIAHDAKLGEVTNTKNRSLLQRLKLRLKATMRQIASGYISQPSP